MGPQHQSWPWSIFQKLWEGGSKALEKEKQRLVRGGWPSEGKEEIGKGAAPRHCHAQPTWALEEVRSFTHSINRFGLSTYNVSGSMPGPGDTVASQTRKALPSWSLWATCRRVRRNKPKNHTNEHAIVNPDEGTGRGLYKTSTKKPCRLVGQEGFLRK